MPVKIENKTIELSDGSRIIDIDKLLKTKQPSRLELKITLNTLNRLCSSSDVPQYVIDTARYIKTLGS